MDTPETVEKKPESAEAPKPAPEAEAAQAASAKAASEVYDAPKKPEAAAPDAAKPEAPKPEEPKADAAKPEAPKADAPAAAPSTDTKAAAPTDKAPEKDDKDFGSGDIWTQISSDAWKATPAPAEKDASKKEGEGDGAGEKSDGFFNWDKITEAAADAADNVFDTVKDWFDWGGEDIYESSDSKASTEKPSKAGLDALEFITEDTKEYHQKEDFDTLEDGTQVAKDGSWVKLSDQAKDSIKVSGDQVVQHTYKDSNGKDVQIEMKEGEVVRRTSDGGVSVITDKESKITDAKGNWTKVDKATGKVSSWDAGSETLVEQTKDGEKTVTYKDGTVVTTGKDKVVHIHRPGKDDETLSSTEARTRYPNGFEHVRPLGADGARTRPTGNNTQFENLPDGKGVRHTNSEGIQIDVMADKTKVIHYPNGVEIRVAADGTAVRVDKDGNSGPIDMKYPPPGVKFDANGKVIGVEMRGLKVQGQTATNDQGATVTTETDGTADLGDRQGRHHRSRCDRHGRTVTEGPDGERTVTDRERGTVTRYDKDGKPELTYNGKTNETEYGGVTISDEGIRMGNGTFIDKNGKVRTADGDVMDNQGNIVWADGSSIDADGHLRTADGKEFTVTGMGGGSVEAAAAYAMTLASAIAGKTDVSPSEIAALQAVISNMGSAVLSLSNAGDAALQARATVKDAQGVAMVALAHAQQKLSQNNQPPQNTAPANH